MANSVLRQPLLTLSVQRSASIHCGAPESKHFRLCWPHTASLCCCHPKAATRNTQVNEVAVFQNLIYRNKHWPHLAQGLSFAALYRTGGNRRVSGSVGVLRMLLIIMVNNCHPTKEHFHTLRGLVRAYLSSNYTTHTV